MKQNAHSICFWHLNVIFPSKNFGSILFLPSVVKSRDVSLGANEGL
jgi:hypothetical protein